VGAGALSAPAFAVSGYPHRSSIHEITDDWLISQIFSYPLQETGRTLSASAIRFGGRSGEIQIPSSMEESANLSTASTFLEYQ
jgi:hypothetical protein